MELTHTESPPSAIYKPEMRIAAVMDSILYQRGAEKLFIAYVNSLRNRGHTVDVYTTKVSDINRECLIPLECVGTRRKIVRLITDGGYDAVWVMHFKTMWILPLLAKPTVLHFLEPPRSYYEPWIYKEKPFYMKALIKVHGLIDSYIGKKYIKYGVAISSFAAENAYRAYGKFLNTVYPGVDEQMFYPENMWARRNYVLLVGGGDRTKQVELAIASLALLHEDVRPKLGIVSKKRDDLQKLADDFKVTIEWHENITTEKLRQLYQRAICTVCTSVAEPFGLTAIESVACGTPVVAVDEGGFRETVTECVGVRVARHPLPMAEAIAFFITNPKRVELDPKFHLENCVDSFEDILSEIVQKQKRKP